MSAARNRNRLRRLMFRRQDRVEASERLRCTDECPHQKQAGHVCPALAPRPVDVLRIHIIPYERDKY